MKAFKFLIIGIIALSLGSCIPSLYPLYTQEDIIYDDRILGEWDGGFDYIGIWTIEKLEHHPGAIFMNPRWTEADEDSDPGNIHYKLTVRQKTDIDTVEAEFILHLLELGGQSYVNIHPSNYELDHGFLSWHMIEANTFMRINITEEKFDVQAFDPGFLEDLIDNNRIRISHVRMNGILVTAPTKDLQQFVIKYSDEEGALFEPDSFARI